MYRRRERVHRTAAFNRDDGRHFDMAEDFAKGIVGLRLARLFVADRQFPKRIKDKPLLLMLPRHGAVGAEIERILRLLIVIAGIIEGLGERWRGRPMRPVRVTRWRRQSSRGIGRDRAGMVATLSEHTDHQHLCGRRWAGALGRNIGQARRATSRDGAQGSIEGAAGVVHTWASAPLGAAETRSDR